jgi:hypothetical protein
MEGPGGVLILGRDAKDDEGKRDMRLAFPVDGALAKRLAPQRNGFGLVEFPWPVPVELSYEWRDGLGTRVDKWTPQSDI